MKRADVPNSVRSTSSARSNNVVGDGYVGDPSYTTAVASLASTDASQFHIIQPVVVKYNTRSPARMSHCSWCSARCFSSAPPARCTMHFGAPVVPDEKRMYHG